MRRARRGGAWFLLEECEPLTLEGAPEDRKRGAVQQPGARSGKMEGGSVHKEASVRITRIVTSVIEIVEEEPAPMSIRQSWPAPVSVPTRVPSTGGNGVPVVIVFFFREHHLFSGFGSTMSRITWIWVILSFLAEMASIPPLAEAQRVVLAAAGTTAPRWKMILVTVASNAISMSVPAGV